MMAGAVSALPASAGPLESEGGRWWPPVGDFGLGVAVLACRRKVRFRHGGSPK